MVRIAYRVRVRVGVRVRSCDGVLTTQPCEVPRKRVRKRVGMRDRIGLGMFEPTGFHSEGFSESRIIRTNPGSTADDLTLELVLGVRLLRNKGRAVGLTCLISLLLSLYLEKVSLRTRIANGALGTQTRVRRGMCLVQHL